MAFSSILQQASAPKASPPPPPSLEADDTDGPLRQGRVKSFSQKSGWGFIQLFEDVEETLESARDVFFHRADVMRAGPIELRPGMRVHCHVVSTGKGEKASGITLVEGEEEAVPGPSEAPLPCVTHPIDTPDLVEDAPLPSLPTSAYALRGTGHCIGWHCLSCRVRNIIPGRLRVMVVCATCRHAHAVQQWVCQCGHFNRRESRQCLSCDEPYATACQELDVQLAAEAPQEAADPASAPAPTGRRLPVRRSRWAHTSEGWTHPHLEAPAASAWCQDGTTSPMDDAKCGTKAAQEARVLAQSQETLMWARDWLLNGQAPAPKDEVLSRDWLYRFSEELCAAQHGLLCPIRGGAAIVPNPCADTSDTSVLRMYEALGAVLGLAVVLRMPLHPRLPVWMARALLGSPLGLEDLNEFDPALYQRACLVTRHPNVEALNLPFLEEITRYGVTRSFPSPLGPRVTAVTQQLYGLWLKEVHLHLATEAHVRQMQRGFVGAIQGCPLPPGLSPEGMAAIINGGQDWLDSAMLPGAVLRAGPVLEGWALQAIQGLSPLQRQQLLRLVTGLGKLPVDGLDPEKPIVICHDPRLVPNGLPVADPLNHQLVLPAYSTREALQQALWTALGSQSFGFASHPLTLPALRLAPPCAGF